MKPAYLNLCTEFYDITKPEAGPKEVAFYEKLLRTARGPILEAMCGSGRLLIPLLKRGLVVDGVDGSEHMLESCQRRCGEQGLKVQLYRQVLQNLALGQRYDLIFIAIGSFQLIYDREEASQVLKKLFEALVSGGRLVVETFVPWDSIKENIQGERLAERSARAGEVEIKNRSMVSFDFKEQLEMSQARYEKWVGGKFVCAEEEEYRVRWYYRDQMELFLKQAGFLAVDIVDAVFEQNEQAVVYIGSRG